MAESTLNPGAWEGRCVHSESTLHQLSPFLGKMKSTMAKELVTSFTEPGDTIVDPFSGSGTVPLEAAINDRAVYGIDRNPYSIILTEAKLDPPPTVEAAIQSAEYYIDKIDPEGRENSKSMPDWVSKFFHPKTLSGLSQLFPLLLEEDESFLLACLLGILHHQRPGFLSFPASHLRPYLRDEKFPRSEYPEKYKYRKIRPRLISKVERAFRRFPKFNDSLERKVLEGDTPAVIHNNLETDSVDAMITSPPYMNKLDYGRDNRLRLFFLGINDYSELDGSPETKEEYENFIDAFLQEAIRVLKPGGRFIFVLGESERSGAAVDTANILIDMVKRDDYGLSVETAVLDKVPKRKINSMSSKEETIIVLRGGR